MKRPLMNTERVRQIIEATGLTAVIVSLLFVAYQIRQANRIAQATTTYEIVRDINAFNEFGMTDPMFADFLERLGTEDFKPSDGEAVQAQLLAYRFLNIWIMQETAYQNGLFTEDQLSLTKADVLQVVNDYPALLPHWIVALKAQPGYSNFEVLQPLVELSTE